MKPVELSRGYSPATLEITWNGRIRESDFNMLGEEINRAVLGTIVEKLADEFIREKGQELLASLDVKAIVNLAVAQTVTTIGKTIEQKSR